MSRVPLMYHDGSNWRKWECYRESQDNVAIFVGGGPSLNKININELAGPGKTIFGVNTTYPLVRPDIWVGMDDPRCYDHKVFHEAFPKVMRGNYYDKTLNNRALKDYPNTYFASVKDFSHKADIFYRMDSDAEYFIWNRNVFVTTINLMLYMGFRKIYLAGVDFSIFEGDYHYAQSALEPKYKKWNQNLYDHLYRYVDWFASTGKMCGIEVYSISPDSKINNIIPYISLEDLNSSIELPSSDKLYHCGELEETKDTVSENYKKLLEHEHNTSQWGVMAGNMINTLETFLKDNNAKEVLDYGAGSSSFSKALTLKDIKVFEYDPGVSRISATPDPCDYTICIDVLEHIEPLLLDNVLEDLARVTKIKGYFTIATYPAKRILKDGRNAHLIVENLAWWTKKLLNYFNINKLEQSQGQINVEVESRRLL